MSYFVPASRWASISRRWAASAPSGGFVVQPEFVALVLGLAIYTGSFIAEIVRSGILAVSKGQWEAARSLGLSPRQTSAA